MKIFETVNKEFLAFMITTLLIITDQITKYFVALHKASLYPPMEIFSWFNFVYVENKGISFGILSKFNISFYLGIVSFFVSFYIIYLLKNLKRKLKKLLFH